MFSFISQTALAIFLTAWNSFKVFRVYFKFIQSIINEKKCQPHFGQKRNIINVVKQLLRKHFDLMFRSDVNL